MRKIVFVSKVRGFLKQLNSINSNEISFEFIDQGYEIPSKKKQRLSKILRSNLVSHLGLIQVLKFNLLDNDEKIVAASFNRFIKTNVPYLVYLENPTALYHYTLNRNKTFLGRKNFKENLNDKHLQTIICMSNACKNTLDTLFNPSQYTGTVRTIYPLVRKNKYISVEKIREKVLSKELKLLFVCQGARFISKGGLELVYTMERLANSDIKLTIISNINNIPQFLKEKIKNNENITFLEFAMSYDEVEKTYSEHHVLIHPTSDESFGLTVLESIKAGLPVISTKLYAIPELVEDGVNGYLTDPKWWFFDKKNLPNPSVWNNRKKTLFSLENSIEMENFLIEKIQLYFNNRSLLFEHSKASFIRGNSEPFNEEFIVKQWISAYDSIEK
ncbi:glycosyltransferase family 4 protein [Enterococcus faecium]|nr:glycosyltransferase family 4 protein [Enterococcus faecium]